MSSRSRDLQLRMVLTIDADYSTAKPPSCPDLYEIWTFEGDTSVLPSMWCDLVNCCFPEREEPFTDNQFINEFSSKPQWCPDGFFMITTRSKAVGTAFAWRDTMAPDAECRLHWLAVHPNHRGKGIGELLVSLVVNFFKETGQNIVTLRTQGHRIPAIRLYSRLGFIIDPSYGDGVICSSPLRLINVPQNEFLGFKACPGADASKMLSHCAKGEISKSRDPLWSGIYVQLSLLQALNYLTNQYARPRGHGLHAEGLASIVRLSVKSPGGLNVAVCEDPRLGDQRISNLDKAWIIFDVLKRTWPHENVDILDLWRRLKDESQARQEYHKSGMTTYSNEAKEEVLTARPIIVMDEFAKRGMALCLIDAEDFELCMPHSLFSSDMMFTQTILRFAESQMCPETIGSMEYVGRPGDRQDDDESEGQVFLDLLPSHILRLSNKGGLFKAEHELNMAIEDVFTRMALTVRAQWHTGKLPSRQVKMH